MPTGSSVYPGGLDGFEESELDANLAGQDLLDTTTAVNRIESELGTNPSGPAASVAALLAPTVHLFGTGSPEGVVTGNPGEVYRQTDGGLAVLWTKRSGVGTNTGWNPIQANRVRTLTSGSTVALDEETLLCDATTGGQTHALPTAASAIRRKYTFKKIDSTANTVIINPNASELVDGALTKTLSSQWEFATVYSDGTAWYVIASGAGPTFPASPEDELIRPINPGVSFRPTDNPVPPTRDWETSTAGQDQRTNWANNSWATHTSPIFNWNQLAGQVFDTTGTWQQSGAGIPASTSRTNLINQLTDARDNGYKLLLNLQLGLTAPGYVYSNNTVGGVVVNGAQKVVLKHDSGFFTTLSSGITSGATSMTVASATDFPDTTHTGFYGDFYVMIANDVDGNAPEIVKVTAGAGTTTWTIVRAQMGTTAAAHASGREVFSLYELPVPWDANLRIHATRFLRDLAALLNQSDGKGLTWMDHIGVIKVMSSAANRYMEMNIAYGTKDRAGTTDSTQLATDPDTLAWNSIASEVTRRANYEDAWSNSIDDFRSIFPKTWLLVFVGEMWADSQTGARNIIRGTASRPPKSTEGLCYGITHLQIHQSLSSFAAKHSASHTTLRIARARGYTIILQPQSSSAYDTDWGAGTDLWHLAFERSMLDEGVGVYGSKILEIQKPFYDANVQPFLQHVVTPTLVGGAEHKSKLDRRYALAYGNQSFGKLMAETFPRTTAQANHAAHATGRIYLQQIVLEARPYTLADFGIGTAAVGAAGDFFLGVYDFAESGTVSRIGSSSADLAATIGTSTGDLIDLPYVVTPTAAKRYWLATLVGAAWGTSNPGLVGKALADFYDDLHQDVSPMLHARAAAASEPYTTLPATLTVEALASAAGRYSWVRMR